MSRKKMHPSSLSWLPSNLWNSATNTSLSVVWIELNCWSSCESISLSTSILFINTATNYRTNFPPKFRTLRTCNRTETYRTNGSTTLTKSLPNILLVNSWCFTIGRYIAPKIIYVTTQVTPTPKMTNYDPQLAAKQPCVEHRYIYLWCWSHGVRDLLHHGWSVSDLILSLASAFGAWSK